MSPCPRAAAWPRYGPPIAGRAGRICLLGVLAQFLACGAFGASPARGARAAREARGPRRPLMLQWGLAERIGSGRSLEWNSPDGDDRLWHDLMAWVDRKLPMNVVVTIIFLSAASSIDNFLLGLALGSGGRKLPCCTILIVASMNAIGMMLSGYLGVWMASVWAPAVVAIIAAVFFIALGLIEIATWWFEKEGSLAQACNDAVAGNACVLALPMTLNNVLCGLGSGMAGTDIWILGAFTFVASIALCWIGHLLGMCFEKSSHYDPRLLSGILFILLGLYQIVAWAIPDGMGFGPF